MIASVAAALVVVVDIGIWIRWSGISRQDVRLRSVTATVAAVPPTSALFLSFVMVLNLSTVKATIPAFAALFEGSR